MARAVQLLSGEVRWQRGRAEWASYHSRYIDARRSMKTPSDTMTAYYVSMGVLPQSAGRPNGRQQKAESSVSALARSEQLHAIDIARKPSSTERHSGRWKNRRRKRIVYRAV